MIPFVLTVGIYARKSVYRDNSDSVQVQIKFCKDYASLLYRGKELAFKIYDQDEGFSRNNTNRPSFQALVQDVRNYVKKQRHFFLLLPLCHGA